MARPEPAPVSPCAFLGSPSASLGCCAAAARPKLVATRYRTMQYHLAAKYVLDLSRDVFSEWLDSLLHFQITLS